MASEIKTTERHIRDTFRPKRRTQVMTIYNYARAVELAEAGRFTLPEALRQMNITPKATRAAISWLENDDAKLNRKYDTDLHRLDIVEQRVKQQIAA